MVGKWMLILSAVLLVLVFAAAAAVYAWFEWSIRMALPKVSGETALAGLEEKVEIIRDAYGIPHIYAGNESDLYFAFGFAMAQDRLWQMELYRRLGQGRMAQVFGAEMVALDLNLVWVGGPKMLLKGTPGTTAPCLDAFANGINAYLREHRSLPIEFKLVGFEPEPWGPEDYLAVLRLMTWSLSFGMKADLTAVRILEKVGEAKMRDAFPPWPDDGPLIIPGVHGTFSGVVDRAAQIQRIVEAVTGMSPSAASNNWVVAGKKSVTGKPLLANDPHLELTNPSFWWEVHLVCPTRNVSGVAVPGTPAIVIGHNDHLAWGVTSTMVDDVDYYLERINPANSHQYWFKDHWEDMAVVEETIPVKGRDAVKEQILLTRHGPLVENPGGTGGGVAVAAKWSFNDARNPAEAVHVLATAKNAYEAQDAIREWEVPGLNVVFADVDGNIGYRCCAAIPVRSRGSDGLLPVPGWSGEYEWQGYVPSDEKPCLLNPEDGFIASANNKVVDGGYPYVIGRYWDAMDRTARIHRMIASRERLSRDDFVRMQQDVFSISASEIVPRMVQALEGRSTGADAAKAMEILSNWNYMVEEDSVGACIFEVFYNKILTSTFRDELGEDLFTAYLKAVVFPPRAMLEMVRKGASPWFDDVNSPETETMEDIMAASLSQAVAELNRTLGSDIERWTWGRLHTLTFVHALGRKKPLDRIFNIGPYPLGGDGLTVNNEKYPYDAPYKANHGVSMRMIVDLSDVAHSSVRVLPTGESGCLGSPHYTDQIGLYLDGKYHPDWTERSEIEKHSEGTLVLKPKP